MNKYMPRIVDSVLENKLKYMGAVLIEGCKWCGKSTTARQFAKSYIEFQDPDKKCNMIKQQLRMRILTLKKRFLLVLRLLNIQQ